MLRAFHPLDFLAVETLLAEFAAEAPEVVGLRDAVFATPEHLRIWAMPQGPRGFAFLPGQEVRILGGLYARDPQAREALLEAAIAPLQAAGTLALMAPERFGEAVLAPGLKRHGFQRIERIDMVQELCRVPPAPLDVPEPFRLIDWDPARDPEAASLLSASTQGTIDGLFLCFPELPTPEACMTRLAEIREGRFGTFLPDVSAMVLDGERLVGVLIATLSAPDEVFLYELALSRDVQGGGLAPMLIRRLQERTRARACSGIRFMWCDLNRAVRKLFPPETIVTETREPWWIWRSEAYRGLRPKRGSVPIGG